MMAHNKIRLSLFFVTQKRKLEESNTKQGFSEKKETSKNKEKQKAWKDRRWKKRRKVMKFRKET